MNKDKVAYAYLAISILGSIFIGFVLVQALLGGPDAQDAILGSSIVVGVMSFVALMSRNTIVKWHVARMIWALGMAFLAGHLQREAMPIWAALALMVAVGLAVWVAWVEWKKMKRAREG